MRRGLILVVVLVLYTGLPVRADKPAPSRVTLNLRDTPLRDALTLLFNSSGVGYTVDARLPNVPVTLTLRDVSFADALDTLLMTASSSGTRIVANQIGGTYRIRVDDQPALGPAEQIEKIPIQFLTLQDLFAALGVDVKGQLTPETTAVSQLVPPGIRVIKPLPVDNSLLVRGTPPAIAELKNLIRLSDVPARTIILRVGVTGPGADGRALNVQSIARTMNGREVTLDETTTIGGQNAHVKVRLNPIVQGDGGLLIDSDWDLSLPLAGGPRGPIRLVKRLSTTTRMLAGRGTAVGDVDMSTWGGKGSVRLWIRPDLLEPATGRTLLGPEDEEIGSVAFMRDQPYLPVEALASALFEHERAQRAVVQFVPAARSYVIQGAPPRGRDEPQVAGTVPGEAGPFGLRIGDRSLSQNVRLAVMRGISSSQLTPDQGGAPYFPLSDLLRVLGGTLELDPATDTYRIVGGRPLRTLLAGNGR